MISIKLHRCSNQWVKVGGHPCWRVQKELDAAGVDYEVVKGPYRRAKRDELEKLSGQRLYPVIEFEDGSVYRDESNVMADRIRSGKLMEKQPKAAAPSAESNDGTTKEWPAQ
ncbi:MAG TPA: glutathione S-transferase N-terminal domain-containing protein [Gaiellaceae bacterium]|nr:glutathione S-transferase N-terminal domain-containing protein [Gaiellaceae bacterium]